MARARNIKPGFFTNDDLVELPFATRLLFIGLWTLADREGRIEDRPKKIKMELFPADDIDVDEALSTLVTSAFIQRYRVDGCSVIQVTNFAKHQRPHHNESPSVLPPPPDEAPLEPESPTENPIDYAGKSETSDYGDKPFQPRSEGLRPDTRYLNDESPTRIPDTGRPDARVREPSHSEPFEALAALCDATGADIAELSGSVKSRQLGKAKQLLGSGMTVADIGQLAGYCASQHWRTEPVDLFTVEKERSKWELAGKPSRAQTKSDSGRASPATPESADRYFARRQRGPSTKTQGATR